MEQPASMSAVWVCTSNGWSLSVGDPSILGWVTVAGYTLAAVLSLRLSLSASRRISGDFWFGLFLVMACLGVNKQLDLQTALNAFLRCHAQVFDWYDIRRTIQLMIGFVIAMLAMGAILTIGWSMRRKFKSHWKAVLGICLLTTFLALRASSFTHVDTLFDANLWVFRFDHIIELSGILLITLNALALLSKIKQPRPTIK